MASRQEKEGREEAAARRELERETSEEEETAKMESDRNRPGVIDTILKSVAETLEHAKEAVIGKPDETPYHETREGGGDDDYEATEKARETKDTVTGKAEEYKEKAKESGVGKITETAKRAMEKLTGRKNKEEEESGEAAKEKHTETEYEARRKMREMKLREEGYEDEDRKRAEAERETAEDEGKAATRNIFSNIGSVKDAIKEKLTMPTDIVEETQAAREQGGAERGAANKEVVDLEGNPVDQAGRVRLERVDRRSSK